MEVNIADFVSPAFDKVFYDIIDHKHTFYWMKGGRGSTKSSFISLVIPILLLQHPECHAIVLRKIGRTLRQSVYPQVQWGIDNLGLTGLFKSKANPPEISLRKTGQKILFFGTDDPSKIKSIKLPFGYPGIVWFEELDQFNGMDEIRNLNESLLRGGSNFWEFCSFNPPKSVDSWVNIEQMTDEPDRLVHHSTYLDVPHEWLGQKFFDIAENLKRKNEMAYEHEYLGKVTGTGGAVFENVSDRQMSDEEILQFDHIYHGCDFGFSMDPLAFTSFHYDVKHEDLYIFDEIYQTKLSNRRAADMIKPMAAGRMVKCDSAEPKSIAELRECGVNARGARKGPDSVDFGIKWLQERAHIYIDKRRAPNTYREFSCYEYEQDRYGHFISAYPDKDNHAIDSIRYGCEDLMPRAKLRILRR